MRPKYRVEAFIVPTTIAEDELSTTNEIDDVKIANIKMKLASPLKSGEFSPDRMNACGGKLTNGSYELDEPIYDEPIYDEPHVVKSKFQQLPSLPDSPKLLNPLELPKLPLRNKYEDIALTLPPKIPIRSSSLMSIDERGETDGILEEFCFHGYKNGCTALTQRPEEVSEEIFQDNWLRRLESLREREANLSEKETLLQERERLLFKKERELRILERLVREKLKEAELRLKLCQSSQSIESTNNNDTRTRFSENSQRTQSLRSRIDKFPNDSTRNFVEEDKSKGIIQPEIPKNSLPILNEHAEKGALKNPPNSRSSLWSTGYSLGPPKPEQSLKSYGESVRSSFPISSAYSSLRMYKPKIRPRISYDDLDSTLSADVGDSSFVVTSKKFDPAVFKKPQAFTRSSSERRTRQDLQQDLPKDSHHVKYPPHSGFQRLTQEDKILKRTLENVAINQDVNVKYQDYGLIDEHIDSKDTDEARSSYLNLERGFDFNKSEKPPRNSRDRPISWNEDTNEWLRKKRQAYNMANMKLSSDHFENKENTLAANAAREKMKKDPKKKENRARKFGIFR